MNIFTIFYFLYGLAIGSFLNVVIYRLPLKLPIAKGRSMCTKCNKTLGPFDLIPVFSYLFLRGKCRYCKTPISVIYPTIELITGILFILTYMVYGLTLYSIIICLFICLLIVAAGIDFNYKFIPNRISIMIIFLGILSMFVHPEVSILSRILGAVSISGIMLLVSNLTGGGIGGGDIKLFFSTGLFLGLKLNILAFLLGYVIAGITIIIPYLKKQLPKNYEVPMAPYFTVSLIFSALYGEGFIAWYFNLL